MPHLGEGLITHHILPLLDIAVNQLDMNVFTGGNGDSIVYFKRVKILVLHVSQFESRLE
jgi:hypothetical protein